MIEIYNSKYLEFKQLIKHCIVNFKNEWFFLSDVKRNKIKIFQVENLSLNIKSFKIPNPLNQFIYKYLRDSKAKRSFNYASKLIQLNIGTPIPIGYFENHTFWGLKDSYYVCEQITNIHEFREIVENEQFENREEIIRLFTQFTAKMHEAGIEFLDHSPGNTLFKKNQDLSYSFYLVDLNRMKFHKKLNLNTRMKNLSKITHKKEMVEIIANEYSIISGVNENEIFKILWNYTTNFQNKYHNKKKIKQKFGFKW